MASGTAAFILYVGVPIATRFSPVIYRAAQSAYLQYAPAATRLIKHYYDYEGPEGPPYYSHGLEILKKGYNKLTGSDKSTNTTKYFTATKFFWKISSYIF